MKRLVLALLLLWAAPAAALPVIPGAPTSPGMDTRAAYACGSNPTVYHVTSLLDSGANTLRNALEASGPRIVVFERSGNIDLATWITIANPCVTVAGQTAPSPGITVRYNGIVVETHDVLLQHFRIRPGWLTNDAIYCNNAFQAWYFGGSRDPHDIVLDHMSVSWGQDENVVLQNSSRNINVTFWKSITSESLDNPGTSGALCGGGAPNSHGFLVYAGTKSVFIGRSLFAHNYERNPYLENGAAATMMNNVVYDWGGPWGFFFSNLTDFANNPWFASAVGNRFKSGPSTGTGWMFFYRDNEGLNQNGNRIYRLDNTLDDVSGTITEQNFDWAFDPNQGSAPTAAEIPAGYTALASTAVQAAVLLDVGARPLDRDTVDTRIISEVTARTGSVPSTQAAVGGWPTLAVNTRTFTEVGSPHVNSGDGYTNLEKQLQAMALELEEGEEIEVPASATGTTFLTANFTATNGTTLVAYTSGTGGGWSYQLGGTGDLTIQSNGLVNTVVAGSTLTVSNATPISANYDVVAHTTIGPLVSGNAFAIWSRVLIGTETGYYFNINPAAGTGELGRATAGVYTSLDSCSHTFTNGDTPVLTLMARDSGQYGLIDGTLCVFSADVTNTSKGHPGVSASSTTTAGTGTRFEDVAAEDVNATTSCTLCRLRFIR